MRRTFYIAFYGVFIWTAFVSPSQAAGPTNTYDGLSLTFRVKSRHISHFEVCIPVRENVPFRIVWGNETVKDSVSGTVGTRAGDAYPTTIKISEGNGQCRTETGPTLKLDEPDEWSNIVSLTFNHIDTYRFVLSKKGC